LFGFTIGTDIGEVGEKELEGQTTGRFGKRDGSYTGLSQMLSAEYTPMQNFRLEFSATGIYHDISWEIMLHIGSEQCGGPVLAAAVHGHVLIGLDGTKGIKTTSSVVGETFP